VKILRTAEEVGAWRAAGRVAARPVERIGLVPTMGALHAGHLSLIERARLETDAAMASIFVNPTQFGPHEDFSAYPRRETADLAMLERAGTSAAFVPSLAEMYPPGDQTRVDPGPIAAPLEGAARPGHFSGVATVVAKLWTIVEPDVSFFGQKDFQQLRVLQALARERFPRIRVVGCPIIREADGLALSSRNAYLNPRERVRARALSRGLFAARDAWTRGERRPERLRRYVHETVDRPGIAVEYVSAADPLTLVELGAPSESVVLSLAARVGKARLIDNVLLGMEVSELS
jgi:pantoate--beta-alanine ligase